MPSDIELTVTDESLVERCENEQQVRHFNNTLYVKGEKESEFVVPQIEYQLLDVESPKVRMLRLHPTDDISKHVRCDLELYPVSQLPPFIAIQNARGYRKIEEAIEVVHNGTRHALIISVTLERFLRYLRTRIKGPTYIWVRYACVLEFNLQEQKAYWTREFSDRMYAAASAIFDMHEINNRLIGNGYFEKVISPGYAKWTKEWYGRPDEIVLPRVCPVRLGTRPDNESPTMQYRYMPLDVVADEIRVICVMPAEDMAAPLIMHVAHCPIKCEVNFIALSYRWGTDLMPEQVVLNGQTKMIRKNLADAIRFLRMKQAIVPLWIDALSINQDDMIERSREVRRMGEIYDSAMCVHVWAGPKTDDTEDAIDLMLELEKHPVVRFNDQGEFDLGVEPARLIQMCAALYKFLERQYFRRVWILQEIAFASNPAVIAGCRRAISFDTLDKAAYNLHDMLTRDPSLIARIQTSDSSIRDLDTRLLGYARKIFYFRYLVSKGLGGGSMFGLFYKIKTSSPGFLDVLVLSRDFECTDPRDCVYGLWNLAQDRAGLNFEPDYGKPYEQVYTNFTQAWALQHGLLDIIGAVEATPDSENFYETAPSWCPNWNVPATTSSLIRKDYLPTRFMSAMQDQSGKLYSADGNFDREAFEEPLFSFERNILHCTGLIIDQVSLMLEDAPDIPAGPAPKSTWRFHYWTDRLRKLLKEHETVPYDDPDRAICAMLHGDNVQAWPTVAESGYNPNDCPRRGRYVCLPANSRHVLPFATSYNDIEAWNVVDTVLRGRRPFVTENGYCGLGPAYITEGDDRNAKRGESVTWQLAVVAGCSVPLVLREKEDGAHELVGTCFVQGWMDGEWIREIMGAENPKEFWEELRDSARLVIV